MEYSVQDYDCELRFSFSLQNIKIRNGDTLFNTYQHLWTLGPPILPSWSNKRLYSSSLYLPISCLLRKYVANMIQEETRQRLVLT